jgi:hypothetical protein
VLALAAPAAAHVTARSPYVTASKVTELALDSPNEREAPMTGFHVAVPGDFRVVSAQSNGNWLPQVSSTTVFWSGGSLAAGESTTFRVKVDAPSEAGPARITATQHYDSGANVRWPVSLTVLPADEPSQQLGRALVVGVIGLLVFAAIGFLAWRRRGAPVRE